jgi:enterochelin esterase family protein
MEPPSYRWDPSRRYPVLYFLHDFYGSSLSLASHGVADELTRRMADGRLPEFFVAAPSGPGSWFADSHDGRSRYEEFITEDLRRAMEARYRVLPIAGSRGITGISMGGYAAVRIALRHPELFGSVSALSGALIPFGPADLPRYSWIARWSLKRVFGPPSGDNSLAANDVWTVAMGLCFEASPFNVHLRAGTEDVYRLDRVAAQFGSLLNEHGVATTVLVERGGHDWIYWSRAMVSIAEWHGRRFAYDH